MILTQTFFLTIVTHSQVLSVTFVEYGQNVNKHAILGKIGGVYVADVDKKEMFFYFKRYFDLRNKLWGV